MIETVITALFTIILLSGEASAQNVIKKGQHPFAAFIYYTDETINDASGGRFLQSAVLIRLDWLISASIDPIPTAEAPVGFPEKTLMARVGAVTIDNKITLNDDEFEQEREIVQVVRPYGHSAEKAASTDITLLKTLLPFAATVTIGVANMNFLPSVLDKSCSIILFNRRDEDRTLIEITVEMHKNKEQCGPEFIEGLMACGYDSEESKTVLDIDHFCHGNAGGALICDGEVAGIQSYIGQLCRQPHLFNLFSGWSSFIDCGIEQKCNENDGSCQHICSAVYKDETKSITESVEVTSYVYSEPIDSSEIANTTAVSETATTLSSTIAETSSSLATEATTTTTSTTKTSSTEAATNATETTIRTTEATTSNTPSSTITTEPTTTSTEVTTSTTESTTTNITESTSTNTATEPTPNVHDRHSIETQSTNKEETVTEEKPEDPVMRQPKIEAHSDTKVGAPEISRRKNGANSNSARYVNGLMIIFLNLVVAI